MTETIDTKMHRIFGKIKLTQVKTVSPRTITYKCPLMLLEGKSLWAAIVREIFREKTHGLALMGVAQWIEHQLGNQRVAGTIPR